MMNAREKFDAWIVWTGLPDAEIARRLGCDASLPGKLRRDPGRRPGLEVAHAIERQTGEPRADGRFWRHGPIRTEEWLHTDEVVDHPPILTPTASAEGGQS